MSLNVHEEMDQGEDCQRVLRAYFEDFVKPLAQEVPLPEALQRARRLSGAHAQGQGQGQGQAESQAGGGAGGAGSGGRGKEPVTRQRS